VTEVLSLGAGLAAALGLAEAFSIAPGGYIVPGYIALNLDRPGRVIATVLVAMATLLVMTVVGRFVLLYGMRRFVLFLLVGFLLGIAYSSFVTHRYGDPMEAIGFVVPGLIAQWMDRQGVPSTLGSMALVGVVARLVVLLVARV
jgi:poly-gamma-glutamate biosynthesis protein PgsC/CapC